MACNIFCPILTYVYDTPLMLYRSTPIGIQGHFQDAVRVFRLSLVLSFRYRAENHEFLRTSLSNWSINI